MKVVWTKFAFYELKEVFNYYKKNVSLTIAENIRRNILESTSQLAEQPFSGQIEENLKQLKQDHRYIVRGNYKIIYKVKEPSIFITDVFDTRQEPRKMVKRNK